MNRRGQRGGAGLEFVLVFPLLFSLFYSIASYALIFAAGQLLQYAAEEGLRRSISFVDESCYFTEAGCSSAGVRLEVVAAAKATMGEVASGGGGGSMGSLFGQPLDTALQVLSSDMPGGMCCEIQLSYDYANYPFLPPLMVPVPALLSKVASLKL